ncbi:uncharacterized protein LOC114286752 [Camellia sinensis]|uniref:uncharacterized protein LOC114286752 n=1 Tax=Camellia sinensis TaxID=4442 RepID=UPI001036D445|nr:uncharacterized protein LOC114286752 [Camellia sinensis]
MERDSITAKVNRLCRKRKLLISRQTDHDDPIFKDKLKQLQKEARRLRVCVLRDKQLHYRTNVRNATNDGIVMSQNLEGIQLHRGLLQETMIANNNIVIEEEGIVVFPISEEVRIHEDVSEVTRVVNNNIVLPEDDEIVMPLIVEDIQLHGDISEVTLTTNVNILPRQDAQLRNASFLEKIRMYNSMLSFTSMGGKVDHSVSDGRGPYAFRIIDGNLVTEHSHVHDVTPSCDAQLRNASFLEKIRMYNSMLSFTSMGGKVDHSVSDGRGPYAFRISGENYHRIGSLLPTPGEKPKFSQLYIYDTEHELQNRLDVIGQTSTNISGINLSILEGLQEMLNAVNPYVKIFRSTGDLLRDRNVLNLHVRILNSRGERQYIRPTANEVAAIIIGDDAGTETHRDIIVQKNDGILKRISEIHPSYVPLQYPLLFPYGTDGWRCGISSNTFSSRSRNNVSIREFYAFRLQHREFEDLYQGIEDAVVAGDVDASAVGRRFVLPSSFSGGPRSMIQRYQDAMAICRTIGAPDLFITFTCNPIWPEIKVDLPRLPNQLIYVIEFQKRGLPHSHITITLASKNKPITPEQIDEFICVELLDKNTDPLAYETVVRCMIHGPCGAANPNAPCMVDGKCTKHYPKKFCNETTIDDNGFVSYRRRCDEGNTININGFIVDNRWVIPYNRDLLVRYDCHINIERCAHPKLMKYLYKYVNKGPDRMTTVIEDNVIHPNNNGQQHYKQVDEIKQYLDARYVFAIEACQQFVIFNDNDHLHEVIDQQRVHDTMLTKWFEANRTHQSAKELTYVEFPTKWVWKIDKKEWDVRKSHKCIGRLPYAHPTSGERYYLRMLLNKVRGAESFEHIRIVNGVVHITFKSACIALGLLDDDNEWHEALAEASNWASATKLRHMYCTMIMFSDITNPVELWERHWKSFTDDIQYRIIRDMRDSDLYLDDEDLKNLGLLEIEHILNRNGRSLKDFPPMPFPSSQGA